MDRCQESQFVEGFSPSSTFMRDEECERLGMTLHAERKQNYDFVGKLNTGT